MPAHRKRFCLHGHDTEVCGRLDTGQCKACRNEFFRRYRQRPKVRALARIYKRAQRLRDKVAFVEAREAEGRALLGPPPVSWVYPDTRHTTKR
jgi:hypothetical protein